MIKFARLILPIIVSLVLVLSVCAKETVIYENDFSETSLEDFTTDAPFAVSDGVLTLGSGSGSAYISYTVPDEYIGKDMRIEVDFLDHTSTGGITIGATGDDLAETASEFFGYEGFVGTDGTKGAFGCYDQSGAWSGLVAVGQENIDISDIHLTVEVQGNTLTYTVTSLDGAIKYFGIEYTVGTSSLDVYSALSGTFGLRKFYSDKGSFDNFKVTVIEDDEMPTTSKILTFNDISFEASKDVYVVSKVLRGSGAAFTWNIQNADFKADMTVVLSGKTRVFFGMDNLGNGYAFEIDKDNEKLSLYKLEKYAYTRIVSNNVPITATEYSVTVEVRDSVAILTFDAFFEGDDAFCTFDMALDSYTAGKLGVWLEGGKVTELSISESTPIEGDTYINSVVRGADPDVLYYDGTYYLYNRISSGDDIFTVYTSPDLAHWTQRNTVFTHDATYETSSYMSPNVFYYDGTFYMFYAALNADGHQRLYCATSASPLGPFTHKNGQTPLHDVAEIGGHPYLDESGKVYMTYVRFGSGNHIWIEEVTLSNGTVTPVDGTLTKVISPEFEYEIDGYGAITEGGVIYKHGGYYYMIYASGHYLSDYGESYAVAENILGPYTKYEYNEILTSNSAMCGVGDGVLIPSPDGSELYMVYHKHYSADSVEPRYTCIDKVKFVANPSGGADILTVNGPTASPQQLPSNVYRYDVNRDGKTTLKDVLQAFKRLSSGAEYSGRYDVNLNGKEDVGDILLIIKDILG